MAAIIREALNADQMFVTLFTGGMSKMGVNLAGTWVGTVNFYASTDGINFIPAYLTPFASGTKVTAATANGNWELPVGNYLAFKAIFTRTSGTVLVAMGASVDASYQDVFLVSTSKYVSQNVTGGAANTVTQAAQANRAWRLRSLSVGFNVVASAAVEVTVKDGASTVIWDGYVPLGAGAASGGGTFLVPLPPLYELNGQILGGLVNTPGNSMVISLTPGGSVVSTINAEFAGA
jgi:hypothetical protein